MKLSALKINAEAVEEGAWVDSIPELGSIRLRVRGDRNTRFRKMHTKLIEAVPRAQRQRGVVDPETMDQITNKCLAHTCLLGWDGLVDDDDQAIPFTVEKALELLSDPELRPFRDGVAYAVSIVAQTEAEDRTEEEGNSEAA